MRQRAGLQTDGKVSEEEKKVLLIMRGWKESVITGAWEYVWYHQSHHGTTSYRYYSMEAALKLCMVTGNDK